MLRKLILCLVIVFVIILVMETVILMFWSKYNNEVPNKSGICVVCATYRRKAQAPPMVYSVFNMLGQHIHIG